MWPRFALPNTNISVCTLGSEAVEESNVVLFLSITLGSIATLLLFFVLTTMYKLRTSDFRSAKWTAAFLAVCTSCVICVFFLQAFWDPSFNNHVLRDFLFLLLGVYRFFYALAIVCLAWRVLPRADPPQVGEGEPLIHPPPRISKASAILVFSVVSVALTTLGASVAAAFLPPGELVAPRLWFEASQITQEGIALVAATVADLVGVCLVIVLFLFVGRLVQPTTRKIRIYYP